MFSCFLLLLNLIMMSCDLTMVIIWAIPVDLTLGTNSSAATWDDCVSQCSTNPNCVLASTQGSNCLLFEFGPQLVITDSPFASDNKVAFKTINTTSSCPGTPDNSTFYGDVSNSSTPLTLRTYTVARDDEEWLLVPTVTKNCASGWQKFPRELGDWCLRVVYTGGSLSHSNAVSLCSDVSAVLTGPDSMEEYDYLLAYATNNFGSNSVFLWMDGTRTPACSFPANFTSCTDSNTFSFVDPTLTAYNASWWAPDQPSGVGGTSSTLQSVITMMFTSDSNNGKLDDVYIDSTSQSGVLCGMYAG